MQRTHTKTIYSHTLSKLNRIWILIRWKCMCVFGCVQCACQLRKVVRTLFELNEWIHTTHAHTHTLISAMKRKRNENKRQFMTRNFRVGFFFLFQVFLSTFLQFGFVWISIQSVMARTSTKLYSILALLLMVEQCCVFSFSCLQTNLNFILIALVSVTKSVRTHAHTSRV